MLHFQIWGDKNWLIIFMRTREKNQTAKHKLQGYKLQGYKLDSITAAIRENTILGWDVGEMDEEENPEQRSKAWSQKGPKRYRILLENLIGILILFINCNKTNYETVFCKFYPHFAPTGECVQCSPPRNLIKRERTSFFLFWNTIYLLYIYRNHA